MIKINETFSSFSVNDLDSAEKFYSEVTGLKTERNSMGLQMQMPGGGRVFVYQKQDHLPATFTVLNFIVDNIHKVMEQLKDQGVVFEYYKGLTDENRISHGISQNRGPDVAWFKDPAGNILSVLQEPE